MTGESGINGRMETNTRAEHEPQRTLRIRRNAQQRQDKMEHPRKPNPRKRHHPLLPSQRKTTNHYRTRFSRKRERRGGAPAIGKVRDLITKIDFESQPSHIITYNPDAETQTLNGRNGEFDVVPVEENGIVVHLSLSNQTLVRQLRTVTKTSKLKAKRAGSSYDTKYQVANLGPITVQGQMQK